MNDVSNSDVHERQPHFSHLFLVSILIGSCLHTNSPHIHKLPLFVNKAFFRFCEHFLPNQIQSLNFFTV